MYVAGQQKKATSMRNVQQDKHTHTQNLEDLCKQFICSTETNQTAIKEKNRKRREDQINEVLG